MVAVECVKKLSGAKVLVVGDVMLDRYIWGRTERISPEAPVPIVTTEKIENRLGGAGNVVRNLSSLGVSVSLVGLIGNDEEGEIVLNLMNELHCHKEGMLVDRSRPTTKKTRVIAQSQQLIRIDNETTLDASASLTAGIVGMVESLSKNYDAIIVSDYGKGVVTKELAIKLAELSKTNKIMLDPNPANYRHYKGATVAKPNRKEAEQATGIRITDNESAISAAKKLCEVWGLEMVLLSLSQSGLLLYRLKPELVKIVPTQARTVFDVSGAGDTLTAAFTAAWIVSGNPELAAEIGNTAAGVVVEEVGTATITTEKLVNRLEELHV